MFDRCGLCKEPKTLVESHFLPKSIYKIVTNKSHSRSPVLIKGGKFVKTSNQVWAYFLCSGCEGRLSKYGEDHVLRYTYRDSGKFRFQEILKSMRPEYEIDKTLVFSGNKNPKIKISHFVHFAAGIFWKATSGRWKLLGQQFDNNQLGNKYEKQFREFLLGQSQFPDNAVLTMSVSNEKKPFPVAIFPMHYKHDGGYFEHRFYIPGIEFILWIGKLVPTIHRKISISRPSGGGFFFECLDNSPFIKDTKTYLNNNLERLTKEK